MYFSFKKEKFSIKEGQNIKIKKAKLMKVHVGNIYLTNCALEHNNSEQWDKYSQTCPCCQFY